jgi:hypothetical protein
LIVVVEGKKHTRPTRRNDMKLLRSAIVAGLAKKVIDEARKPHNQAKIKAYIAQATSKTKGGRGGPGTTGRRPY